MGRIRPNVMSIAGYDPTGGAGSLADIKTFEQLKVYGFSVLTSLTIQTDQKVLEVNWLSSEEIAKQIDNILTNFNVDFFKIGIVKDENMLRSIVDQVKKHNPKAFITWDPVLKSSGGSSFFEGELNLERLLKGIDLITPNEMEYQLLFEEEKVTGLNPVETTIFRKGGHNTSKPGKDVVYQKDKVMSYAPKGKKISAKHGSGCIMASALTAHLARGFKLHEAVLKSKRYIEEVLSSNESLLAYHKR